MAHPITNFRSVRVTPGCLYVGDGTPNTSVDGSDVYIEGTLEVDGAMNLDGAISLGNTLTVGESGTGYDVIFWGDTALANMTWDADTDTMKFTKGRIAMGTLSSTAQTGVALNSSNVNVIASFADDANTTLGDAVYANILARTMLFKACTAGTVRSLVGQLKLADEADLGPGVFAAVQGYLELYDDADVKSGGKVWAVDASIEAPTSGILTVDSGGILAAFHAELTGAGTLTNSGIAAGLYIDEQITSGKWGHGIYMVGTAVAKAIQVGTLSSTSQTGVTLSSTYPNVIDSFADDGNATLGDAVYSNIRARTMLFKACTAGTIVSVKGQLKFADEADMGPGVFAAVQGYMELYDDLDVKSGGKFWGVDASLEAPSGGILTVNSGGIAAGLHAELTGSGQAVQDSGGILAGLYIDEQITTGNWGYGILIPAGAAGLGIQVGTGLSSTLQIGHHIGQSGSERAISVFADDNNAVFASDCQGINCRLAIFANQNAAYAASAVRGHLRIVGANIIPSEAKAWQAVSGAVETSATPTIGDGTHWSVVCGLNGSISAAGTTVAANGVLAGLHLTGTCPSGQSGEMIGILFEANAQGFEHAFGFNGVGSTDGNGLIASASGTLTKTHAIAVWINGVGTRYIQVGTIA